MAISWQPFDGFSPDFEGEWVAMGNVYCIICMNLPNLMEVQESKHVVVTLKDFLLWHDGIGGCEGKGRARGGCMGKKRRVKGCKWVWGCEGGV